MSLTWMGSAESAQSSGRRRKKIWDRKQQARRGKQRRDQRLYRVILTAIKQDDRYCCRHFDARLSSSIKRARISKKVGLTASPESLAQDKQAVTLKSPHWDARFVNFNKGRAKGRHQLPEHCPISMQRESSAQEKRYTHKTEADIIQNCREHLSPKMRILISITNLKNGKKVRLLRITQGSV